MPQPFRMTPLVCLASTLCLIGMVIPAVAQDGQGKYLTEASARLARLIGAGNKQGYELQNNLFCLGGAWLKKAPDTWVPLYTLKLEQGKKYRFIAAGDSDAKDIDLEIQDPDGKVVAQDVKTAPEATVDFTPATTGRYVVRLRLYDSVNNVPCFSLAIVMTEKE